MIEDAKFESVANQEFERQERLSKATSPTISEENFDFDQNGDVFSDIIDADTVTTFDMVLSMKDGMSSLSRLIKIIEVSVHSGLIAEFTEMITSQMYIARN